MNTSTNAKNASTGRIAKSGSYDDFESSPYIPVNAEMVRTLAERFPTLWTYTGDGEIECEQVPLFLLVQMARQFWELSGRAPGARKGEFTEPEMRALLHMDG